MRVIKITTEQATKNNQTKKFGIISEGCTGVWGEGETIEQAQADALKSVENLDGCWAEEIA